MNRINIYFENILSTGIHIVYDNVNYHHLRSIPFLYHLNFTNYTYPKKWNNLNKDFIPYNYILDRDILRDNLPEKLVCITNQYYEINESQYSINKTIKKFINSPNTLILVLDKRNFEIMGKMRPLEEENFITYIYSYDELYNMIRQLYQNEGFSFILKNTKNLFFQDNALLLNEIDGIEINTFDDFFKNLINCPYLPIWDFFSYIFGIRGEYLEREKIKKLISFLRYRIELKYSQLKKFINSLFDNLLDNTHYLDPVYRIKITKEGYNNEFNNFRRKLEEIKNELLKQKFLKYLNW
ncbi:MAG: hypothetical protein ACTSQP_00575 [Promethearchaeota archaeon]